eukprot:TRINITY_DN93503_c0_g1_i1.p1 TRINITY_DN93503_c0_g1~~TRINITY_DN93503_c0_g1_i1.p1  ORF type:complete len:189 (+),score=36.85 TRINITY_DN93503_c0_g1_i1:265-831(+)
MWSLAMPTLVASLWGEARNGFLVAGALRWMCVQHITFFVNSVAHGEQDGTDERAFDVSACGIGPRVSVLVSILALGEGWHDYHHLMPWDYACAELGAWDQWNPTKVFIDFCCALGLAKGRRRCSSRLQELQRTQLAEKNWEGPVKERQYKIVGWPLLRYRVPVRPHSNNCKLAEEMQVPFRSREAVQR